jgi:hypothetical protein
VGLTNFVLAVHAQNSPNTSQKPKETTVCQIVADCRNFNGKLVRFRASVLSDWFEYTALVDSSCERGIVPGTLDDTDKRPSVGAFFSTLEMGRQRKNGKAKGKELSIKATFTGRFICNLASPEPTKRRIIQIVDVEDLEVKKIKTAQQ